MLVLATVVLSGCFGGGASPEPADITDEPSPTAADPEVTDDTCAIVGVVVDDEWIPVALAEVLLVPSNESTASAKDGAYTFNGVPPGFYNLTAAKADYETSPRRAVECAAGQVVQVPELILTKLASIQRVFSWTFSGVLGCGVHASHIDIADYCSSPLLTDGAPPDAPEELRGAHLTFTPPSGNITGMVVELDWQANAGLVGGERLLVQSYFVKKSRWQNETNGRVSYWEHPEGSSQKFELGGTSSLWARIWVDQDSPDPINTGNHPHSWSVRPYRSQGLEASASVVLSQGYDIYVTYFYDFEPIPPGYTLLPD